MKTLKFNLLFLLLLCLGGCSDDDGAGSAALTVDKTALLMKIGEDTQAVMVSGGDGWEVSVPQEDNWCSVMKMSATKFVVMVVPNEGPDSRKTTVTLTNGGENILVTVEQKGEISYTLEPEKIFMGATGDSVKVVMTANCEWTCSADAGWCRIGRMADTLWLSADTSRNAEPNSGYLNFTMNGVKDYLRVELTQSGYIDPELTVDPTGVIIKKAGDVVTLHIESKLPWTYGYYISSINGTLDFNILDENTLEITLSDGFKNYENAFIFIRSGEMDYFVEKTVIIAI